MLAVIAINSLSIFLLVISHFEYAYAEWTAYSKWPTGSRGIIWLPAGWALRLPWGPSAERSNVSMLYAFLEFTKCFLLLYQCCILSEIRLTTTILSVYGFLRRLIAQRIKTALLMNHQENSKRRRSVSWQPILWHFIGSSSLVKEDFNYLHNISLRPPPPPPPPPKKKKKIEKKNNN